MIEKSANGNFSENRNKGTVRNPTVASGRGYCLQTAHLGSWRLDFFVRSLANLPSHGGGKGGNPTYPDPTTR